MCDTSKLDAGIPDLSRIYEAHRRQIEAEDALIGVRVGWFLASEAFLFAAYGTVLAVQGKAVIRGSHPMDDRLFEAVPIVGVLIAVLVGLGIGAAMHQMRLLTLGFRDDVRPHGYPSLWAKRYIVLLGHVTPALIAPVVLLAWVFVRLGRTPFLVGIPIVLAACGAAYLVHITLAEYALASESPQRSAVPSHSRADLWTCFATAWRERVDGIRKMWTFWSKVPTVGSAGDPGKPVVADTTRTTEART